MTLDRIVLERPGSGWRSHPWERPSASCHCRWPIGRSCSAPWRRIWSWPTPRCGCWRATVRSP